ncbi:hypothetical protein [Natrinema thermotolerans]|uniref:hypothetical protein n=1 Tax=Natrinema thermotolerans TaxID=121872 RepID=UPI0006799F72|nr:hypothetical protein [Natrinema thermotolerans]QCC57235.1 hypothetical protein DVR14_00750 [Natrinema thermotolerans]
MNGLGLTDDLRHALGKQQVAIYECDCGARLTIPERRWDAVRYTARRFEYGRLEAFLDANRDCCADPAYSAVEPIEESDSL